MRNKKNDLPMSLEHKKFLFGLKRNKVVVKIVQIGILVAFFGLWELAVKLEWIDAFFMSSPSRILTTLTNLASQNALWNHVSATLMETVYGFLLSTAIGSVVAVLLWCSETAQRVVEPYLIVLNALPKIALGPLIIIWVGAGKSAIIVMALLICVIITIISMLTGFLSVSKEKTQLLKSMGASKFQILTKLVLPANLDNFMSVMKINVGLAWVGTIMGEYLVSREGLGYLIVYGSQVFQLDLVMASTVLLCILAGAMYVAVVLLEKLIIKRDNIAAGFKKAFAKIKNLKKK